MKCIPIFISFKRIATFFVHQVTETGLKNFQGFNHFGKKEGLLGSLSFVIVVRVNVIPYVQI